MHCALQKWDMICFTVQKKTAMKNLYCVTKKISHEKLTVHNKRWGMRNLGCHFLQIIIIIRGRSLPVNLPVCLSFCVCLPV